MRCRSLFNVSFARLRLAHKCALASLRRLQFGIVSLRAWASIDDVLTRGDMAHFTLTEPLRGESVNFGILSGASSGVKGAMVQTRPVNDVFKERGVPN